MGNEKQKIEADKAREAIELKSINTIRTLSMDAVQAANSGHPGTAMALAPVAYTLWNDVLRFDPPRLRDDSHHLVTTTGQLPHGHAGSNLHAVPLRGGGESVHQRKWPEMTVTRRELGAQDVV